MESFIVYFFLWLNCLNEIRHFFPTFCASFFYGFARNVWIMTIMNEKTGQMCEKGQYFFEVV